MFWLGLWLVLTANIVITNCRASSRATMRLEGVPRQQCAENQIGDDGFHQGAGRLLVASRNAEVVGGDIDFICVAAPLLTPGTSFKAVSPHSLLPL
jgi:hypothetical protein